MIQPESSILRVLKNNSVVGAAFLAANGIAVTCAHVVEAVGKTKGDSITLRLANGESTNAIVDSDLWRDVNVEDISILRLEESTSEILPLVLGSSEGTKGHTFLTFGFPQSSQELTGRGEIVGYAFLNGIKLIQLRSEQVTPGFSGAPVFDEKTQRVVGMIVAITPPDEYKRQGTTAFAIPSETIREICAELQVSDICPYLGLETFTDETSQFFFGRETLTEKLLNVLRGGCRFLAVFGPSGSGKSSVVQAGLLPTLKKGQLPGSQKWAQITMRPADNPFEQMKAAGLDSIDINGYLEAHADVERVLLFIDQFEELFTLCPDDLRNHFISDLATALENSRLILILSMRDDFYSAFNAKAAPLAESEHLKIENVPGNLKRDELVAMIERPAEAVGLALEEGLTEMILKDVTTDGEARSSTLPLLEFALTQLWEKRRDGLLTHEAYQSIGGVTGSLARWADDAYSDLPKEDQLLAESLLTSLVHLGDETQGLPDTRRRRTLTEFDDSTRSVIKHFTDRRLIVTSGETVELVHDALVREWGRLRVWINNNRSNLLTHHQLTDAAQGWQRNGRDAGDLYRGIRLVQALEWANTHSSEMSPLEAEYLKACRTEQSRERWAVQIRWASIIGAIAFGLVVGVLALTGRLNRFIYPPMPMEWVEVPAGEFLMGREDSSSNEIPVHYVYLDTYEIGKYEVTNQQYLQCVKGGVCSLPRNGKYNTTEYANHPVVDVSWFDADTFCTWNDRNGRLPTEAEWEKAARGTDGRTYPWGEGRDNSYVNYLANVGDTAIVGSYPKGVSPYGAYDMAGNVLEWVADWFFSTYYRTYPIDQWPSNPSGPEDGYARVLRGGSWNNRDSNVRSTARYRDDPTFTINSVGFRCARSTSPSGASP